MTSTDTLPLTESCKRHMQKPIRKHHMHSLYAAKRASTSSLIDQIYTGPVEEVVSWPPNQRLLYSRKSWPGRRRVAILLSTVAAILVHAHAVCIGGQDVTALCIVSQEGQLRPGLLCMVGLCLCLGLCLR